VLKTPKKSKDLRQQYLFVAAELEKAGVSQHVRDLVLRWGHTASTSLHTVEMRDIEVSDIRRQYAGQKAAMTDRRVLSEARVITGATVAKMREERVNRGNEKTRRAKVRAAKAKGKQRATSSPPTASSPATPSPSITPPTLETPLPPPPITPSPPATPLPPKKRRQRKPKIKVEPGYEEGTGSQHAPSMWNIPAPL